MKTQFSVDAEEDECSVPNTWQEEKYKKMKIRRRKREEKKLKQSGGGERRESENRCLQILLSGNAVLKEIIVDIIYFITITKAIVLS